MSRVEASLLEVSLLRGGLHSRFRYFTRNPRSGCSGTQHRTSRYPDGSPSVSMSLLLAGVCVQKALKQAGCRSPGQLPFRPDCSPQWPAGFVGQIALSDLPILHGLVGTTNNLRGVGVDIESYISPKVAGEIAPRDSSFRGTSSRSGERPRV